MSNYFRIIDESNIQILELINKQKIPKSQYFPVFAFATIYGGLKNIEILKQQQRDKIDTLVKKANPCCAGNHDTPDSVFEDDKIPNTYKVAEIVCSIMNGNMTLDSAETYLRDFGDKKTTNYRKILCAYDLKKYDKH